MVDAEAHYFVNNLRAWRKYFRLTQEALAEILETNASMICQLETGRRGISGTWLARYAKVFGVTPGIIADHDPFEMPEEIKDLLVAPGEPVPPEVLRILRLYQISKLEDNIRPLPKPDPKSKGEGEDSDEAEEGGQG